MHSISELKSLEDNKLYEIVLGGSGNTFLYLRKSVLANTVKSTRVDQMVSFSLQTYIDNDSTVKLL